MFLTWQLWNALHFPQWRHPIFLYARKSRVSKQVQPRLWRIMQILAITSLILFAIIFPVPAVVTALGISLGIPAFLIIFNGTILGTTWLIGITSTLSSAHNDNRFELLTLTSQGALGGTWLLSTGVVHQRNWLQYGISYRSMGCDCRACFIGFGNGDDYFWRYNE